MPVEWNGQWHRRSVANGLWGKTRAFEHLRTPGEQDIAQQDRSCLSETGSTRTRKESLETTMSRWCAPPGVGAVQQVVVNQEGGV